MVDVTKIIVKAGDGGNGSFSFRREKYIPKGGPDGGDGGHGGSVIFTMDSTKRTLDDWAGIKKIAAENGENGHGQQMSGRKAEDVEVGLPPGTVIWELDPLSHDKIHKLGEILTADDSIVVAYGGKGGRGNQHFKSSRNQTPMEYEVGGTGDERFLLLELKLLADIGFVGFPNAGKSTLLSVLTKARPKIADYPFTTLEPHLGVMEVARASGPPQRYVVADIPGLIEDASTGKGLGHRFLRHIERCRLLIYLLYLEDELLLDAQKSAEERMAALLKQFSTLHNELQQHEPELARRPFLVVLNKIDVLEPEFVEQFQQHWSQEHPETQLQLLSGATQQGLDRLKQKVDTLMQKFEAEQALQPLESEDSSIPVYTLPVKDDSRKPVLSIRPPLKKVS